MTTLIIDNKSTEARNLIKYARTFSFVKVADEVRKTERRLKPEVEQSILRSMRGEDLSKTYNTADEMFEALGI